MPVKLIINIIKYKPLISSPKTYTQMNINPLNSDNAEMGCIFSVAKTCDNRRNTTTDDSFSIKLDNVILE